MVVRGRIRGNGSQLAKYLTTKADNENVMLFDIRGTCNPDNIHLSLLEMSLTSELTRSDKGIYHVQLCPAYGDDKRMTREAWLRAAEILEEETGFQDSKRIMELHLKNGRYHMHLAYERYDHETGVMKKMSFSRLAQDRARIRMEKELELTRTPERNKHRPILKQELTDIWSKTTTGRDFLEAVKEKGYAIAAGTQRPYMVIDHDGVSADLVRQLKGVKTKEVRERLKDIKLPTEKKAIRKVRERQAAERLNTIQENAIDKIMLQQEKVAIKAEIQAANDNDKSRSVANDNKAKASVSYSMGKTFSITQADSEATDKQLKEALDKEEAKGIKKQKALEDFQRKLEKARMFRENERDL